MSTNNAVVHLVDDDESVRHSVGFPLVKAPAPVVEMGALASPSAPWVRRDPTGAAERTP